MKILVLSDSHGAYVNLSYALEDNSDIKSVIYLGDGADDLSKVLYETAGRKVYSVCGNCDFAFNLPLERIETFDGKKSLSHAWPQRECKGKPWYSYS